ncbi:hypothetical protein ACI2OX_21220 [Bacillus sp. N9]
MASADVQTQVFFSQNPVVEDVCPEKVIICGKVTKKSHIQQLMNKEINARKNFVPKNHSNVSLTVMMQTKETLLSFVDLIFYVKARQDYKIEEHVRDLKE